MLAVLSRLFPCKFKQQDEDNRQCRECRENVSDVAESVVYTVVEIHDGDETAIQPTVCKDHSLPSTASPEFAGQLGESVHELPNLQHEALVLPKSLTEKTSRAMIDEVAEFHQSNSYPHTDVRILITKNVIVYVLGTNHANNQCREDVGDIIEKVQPQRVLVELCALRACGCQEHVNNAFQTAPKFTFNYLRSIVSQLGFLPAMIFFTDVFRERLVSESSLLHYGGEFIAAMAMAKNVKDCRLVLADRPISITVKRQASAMDNWRGLRVALLVTLSLIFKRHMKRLMMSANRLIFEDPKTYEVLVFERDLYLTYSIQEAAKQLENESGISRVVAVLGQGHVPGIQNYWGKVPPEFIPHIMSPETLLDQ